MEAKDTVMNEKQIKIALKEKGYNGDGLIIGRLAIQALELQAEISFKAGQEEEAKGDTNAISYTRGVLDGIAKGRGGVVEWVETHEKSTCMDCTCAFAFRIDEWQAKLEEWGIG